MTTMERYVELRARLEELEAFTEHVPPAALETGERPYEGFGLSGKDE